MRGDESMEFLGPDESILPMLGKSSWTDAEEALRDALGMEKIVTGSIKTLVIILEFKEATLILVSYSYTRLMSALRLALMTIKQQIG
jgi:hypothetical protein